MNLYVAQAEIDVQVIESDSMSTWPLSRRLEYLSEKVNLGNVVLILEDIDSIFFDVENWHDAERAWKLRMLINSIPESCGCFLKQQELSKLGILTKGDLIISPPGVLKQIATAYELSFDKWDVAYSGVALDIEFIRDVMILGKGDEHTKVVYQSEYNDFIYSLFSMLERSNILIHVLNNGKLDKQKSESERQKSVEELLASKEKVESILDKMLPGEVAYGKAVGQGIAAFHYGNALHGDLHRSNLLYTPNNPLGVIDLENAKILLGKIDAVKFASDIVTLFIELTPVEWKAFKDGYISVRGDSGREVVNLLDNEWQQVIGSLNIEQ